MRIKLRNLFRANRSEKLLEEQERRNSVSMKGLSWSVDQIEFANGEQEVYLHGWAFTRRGAGSEEAAFPKIRAEQANGTAVPVKITRNARPDVLRAFWPDSDFEEELGFTLTFPFEEDGVYYICFSDGSSEDRMYLSIKSLQVEKREEKRRFVDREAMERYTDSDLESDMIFMKKHWTREKFMEAMQKRFTVRDPQYAKFVKRAEPDEAELARQKETAFAVSPRISIVVPTYRTPIPFLKEMVGSVQAQTYANWELCLADGSEEDGELQKLLRDYAAQDERIRVQFNEKNYGISGNTNEALKLATGDFIALLDHDDLLAPNALFEMVKALNEHPEADFFYSDEDKFEEDLRDRYEPAFKPEFNWDFFRTNNYICHFTMLRASMLREVGEVRSAYDGAQDFDLFLRCAEKSREIVHIPKVLYHWRCHASSTAANPGSKPYAVTAGRNAVIDHLKRIGRSDIQVVDLGDHLYYYRELYPLNGTPEVDIFLNDTGLSKAAVDACEKQLTEESGYRKLRFHRGSLPNTTEGLAEYILLVDGTAKVITKDWVELLLAQCQREEIGAAGGKTLLKQNAIDQAGMAYGMFGTVGGLLSGEPREALGPNCRGVLQQEKSVLCGSCMMVKRSVLEKTGGMDDSIEPEFQAADLCLRIREAGYHLAYEPNAIVSLKRPSLPKGHEKAGIQTGSKFAERYRDLLAKDDPFYGPNYSRVRTNFNYRLEEE
jgi:glycosyltransferase involved in cell wall biosynthesis